MQIDIPAPFKTLFQPARYKAFYGGRGSGKSHSAASALIIQARDKPLRVLCCREVQNSIKDSVKQLLDYKIAKFDLADFYKSTEQEIRGKNGSSFIFTGLGKLTIDQIKSMEGVDLVWTDEAQTISARSLEVLIPTIRRPSSELWFTWNPRASSDPVDERFRGIAVPETAIVRRVNYTDNPFFPAELEGERAYDEIHSRDRYGHIWLGEYEPMAKGAIWNRLMFHQWRRAEAPVMGRIVVAVDPAVSSEKDSDEHGIIVAGIGEDGRGYVLDDVSTRGGPQRWAERAIAAYDRHDADAIVVEINQGGDMVKNTLKSVRPGLRIVEVRATKGKHVRAEPIAALYSEGKISHVGTFPILEDQFCLFTAGGYEGKGSPDHCLVAGTLIETESGEVPIECVSAGDFVLTRKGYRRVLMAGLTGKDRPVMRLETSDGRALVGTGGHPVWVEGSGFLRLDALVWNDMLATCEKRQSNSMGGHIPATRTRLTVQSVCISIVREIATVAWAARPFIERFGKNTMGAFLKECSFITKMATPLTTVLKTWSVLRARNTVRATRPILLPPSWAWPMLAFSRMLGMEVWPASSFIDDWGLKAGLGDSRQPIFASSAALVMRRFPVMDGSGFAQRPVVFVGGKKTEPTGRSGTAQSVARHSWPGAPSHNKHAPISVVRLAAAGRQDVFNLTVEGEKEYFANGILVHNCDAAIWAFSELFPRLVKKGGDGRARPTRANSSYDPHRMYG